MVARQEAIQSEVEPDVISQTYDVLRQLGHNESDARRLVDSALAKKRKYADVQSLLQAIYQYSHGEKETG
jgi:Holliday junction DNA helicase RuvA